MFYTYRQNNSGGSFIQDDYVDVYVIIEAESKEQADEYAESKARIYFDGCYSGRDCNCCGDRWSPAWGGGNGKPLIYGTPVSEYDFKTEWSRRGAYVYYQDGTKRAYGQTKNGTR